MIVVQAVEVLRIRIAGAGWEVASPQNHENEISNPIYESSEHYYIA